MTGTRIAVGVIDGHPLYRSAAAALIAETPGLDLCAEAGSIAQFANRRQCATCVVLLDPVARDRMETAVLELAGMGHRVLVLSARCDRTGVPGAIAAGAAGYLSKYADETEILRAVRRVAAGGRYVATSLPASAPADSEGPTWRRGELSHREAQVLSRLAAGDRDEDIARALRIGVRTVRSHLDRVRDKTGLRRRPELTRYAIEHGVVVLGDVLGGRSALAS